MAIVSILATLFVALSMIFVGYDASILIVLLVLGASFVLGMTWPRGARVLGLASGVLALAFVVLAGRTEVGQCETTEPTDGVYVPVVHELGQYLANAPCRATVAAERHTRGRYVVSGLATAGLALVGGVELLAARGREPS